MMNAGVVFAFDCDNNVYAVMAVTDNTVDELVKRLNNCVFDEQTVFDKMICLADKNATIKLSIGDGSLDIYQNEPSSECEHENYFFNDFSDFAKEVEENLDNIDFIFAWNEEKNKFDICTKPYQWDMLAFDISSKLFDNDMTKWSKNAFNISEEFFDDNDTKLNTEKEEVSNDKVDDVKMHFPKYSLVKNPVDVSISIYYR